ncbi:hypothetical protein BD310DRAFT_667652 [Dichomitus squalens]|uniref:Uncharacterized protein n=1 Tax=Dichomitus squalens TaxID=114155 RepID=A0A4Q9Q6M9_9APHY|nr:hypothetical protein BD310DRAFT_667652 [Dichomitus squalens]
MSTTTSSGAGLLAFRLSSDQFQAYTAEARVEHYAGYEHSDGAVSVSRTHSVLVRGFDQNAVAAIKTANGGKADVLKTSYGPGKSMRSVIRQVEDVLLIPCKHWRLVPRTRLCEEHDTLIELDRAKQQKKPIEILLIPVTALPLYLSKHEYMRDWKRLQPAPASPSARTDSLAQALTTWHLLSPLQDRNWPCYIAQRREAEWNFARLMQHECLSLTTPPFLDKIKGGVEDILKRAGLSSDEQAVIADGVLPQGLEVWDDAWDGLYLLDVTAFTHISSPTCPASLDVFLHYPSPGNMTILYRIHNPAPPESDHLQTHARSHRFYIRCSDEQPHPGLDGWRLFFEMKISEVPKRTRRGTKDVERRTWGLTRENASALHDALFGSLESSVTKLDAALLVLASVGFHMRLAPDGPGWKGADGFASDMEGEFKLGKLEWIGANLRTVCGVPLETDKLSMKEIVEDDSDY